MKKLFIEDGYIGFGGEKDTSSPLKINRGGVVPTDPAILAYTAGILEKATFDCYNAANAQNAQSIMLKVVVAATTADFFMTHWNLKLYPITKNTKFMNMSTTGKNALALNKAVQPYLIAKLECSKIFDEIEEILKKFKASGRMAYNQEEVLQFENIRNRLRTINKRADNGNRKRKYHTTDKFNPKDAGFFRFKLL